MKELTFTLKLKFDTDIDSEEEIKKVMENLRNLIGYGNDNGLINPDESQALLKSVMISSPKSDRNIGVLLNN